MAASVLALAACSDEKVADEDIIATTKVGNITKEDLYEEMKDAIGVQVVENLLLQQALETEYKVSDKELEEAINAQKEPLGENFAFYLQQQGITESFFEKNVKSQLIQKKMIDSLELSDEEIAKGYGTSKTEIHARHILLEDEETAKEIINKLNDGGDFDNWRWNIPLSLLHNNQVETLDGSALARWYQSLKTRLTHLKKVKLVSL